MQRDTATVGDVCGATPIKIKPSKMDIVQLEAEIPDLYVEACRLSREIHRGGMVPTHGQDKKKYDGVMGRLELCFTRYHQLTGKLYDTSKVREDPELVPA